MFRPKTRSLLEHHHDPLVETNLGLRSAAPAVAPGPSLGEFGSAAAIFTANPGSVASSVCERRFDLHLPRGDPERTEAGRKWTHAEWRERAGRIHREAEHRVSLRCKYV